MRNYEFHKFYKFVVHLIHFGAPHHPVEKLVETKKGAGFIEKSSFFFLCGIRTAVHVCENKSVVR